MNPIEDHEFEPVVREAVRARPEPRSISNLAFRAMELARDQARALARAQIDGLLRLRRRWQWIGALATAVIAIVVFFGMKNLSASGVLSNETATTTTTSTDQSTSTSTTPTTLYVGLAAEVLVVVLVLMSVGVASPDEDELAFR